MANLVKRRRQIVEPRGQSSGFTLTELVVVILILAILAAIAAPRLMNVAADAEKAAVAADLSAMRDALELYAMQHQGKYPGSLTALAKYTSAAGAMSSNKTSNYKYGKYLRKIPPCPVGPHKGATGWGACSNPPAAESGSSTVGWLYHAASGSVWVNYADYFDM